jgi:hypothetical protein
MIEEIMKQILKAKEKAIEKGINAQTIILDEEVALFNGMLFDYKLYTPCIFGLKINYKNLKDIKVKDKPISFIITDKEADLTELERLRKENAELRNKIEAMKEMLESL